MVAGCTASLQILDFEMFLKEKPNLQSQNMNITRIIFSALHMHSINQNYIQCLGLGNRVEASLLGVNSPTVETINQKTNNY